MATNYPNPTVLPSAPNDLPPPYSAVVGPQYGFVATAEQSSYVQSGVAYVPKTYTAPGVYPHPVTAPEARPQTVEYLTNIPAPIAVNLPPPVGTEPTTVTCYNCGKVVTTRVNYTTAWHTHLLAGSICFLTMVCSLCCLGLVPYCFDSFKDAEHYCPNCNSFIGKNNRC